MSITTVSRAENITPSKASQWLEDRYDKQRPLRKRIVSFYSAEMQRGAWLPTNTIALAYFGRRLYLVNGQHTLNAVVESGVTLSLNPVNIHTVTEESDIAELYAHYDIGLQRTYNDSLRAYDIGEKSGLSKSHLNRLSSAIKIIMFDFPQGSPRIKIAHDVLVEQVFNWLPEMQVYTELISPCESFINSRLMVSGVLSVALVTLRYQTDKAMPFWEQTAKIDRLASTDPRLALHKVLSGWQMQGRGANTGIYSHHFSNACAYAWNKWYRGLSLKVLKFSVVERTNTYIDGTPFAKNSRE